MPHTAMAVRSVRWFAEGRFDPGFHAVGKGSRLRRLGQRPQTVLEIDAPTDDVKNASMLGRRRAFGRLRVPGPGRKVVPDLARHPGHEFKCAAGRVPTHVDQLFVRNRMTAEAVGGDGVNLALAIHAGCVAGRQTLRSMRGGFIDRIVDAFAEIVMDLDPILGSAMTRFARHPRDRPRASAPTGLRGVMARRASVGAPDPPDTEFLGNLLGRSELVHRVGAVALGVRGRLPRLGLGFVVVAFGALVRADHFGRIRGTHERSLKKSNRHGQPEHADEPIGTSDAQVESHFPSPFLLATGVTLIGTGPITP